MTWLDRWMVRAGSFFFRYRNGLFPVTYGLSALLLKPRVILHPAIDHLLGLLGIAVTLAGELVRLTTIGFEYIERGGKNKQVYASRLVQSGIYSLTRNPMYLGNVLIVLGVAMMAGSPWMYRLVVPFFLFVYWAIVRAEEAYLQEHFRAEYTRYCERVNRFIPRFQHLREALAGFQYNWKRAVRQELSTLALVFSALVLVPAWRAFFLSGPVAAKAMAPRTLALEGTVCALYGIFVWIKRRRLLFYP